MTPFSPEQFATDLLHLYGIANSKKLVPQYLKQLIATFTEMYITEFRPSLQPNAAYKLFLETCIAGLTVLTNAIGPEYIETPGTPLFTIALPPTEPSGDTRAGATAAERERFTIPTLQPALKALANVFKNRTTELHDLGILTRCTNGFWSRGPNPAHYDTRGEYKDAVREDEKQSQEYYDGIPLVWWPFMDSPLWMYVNKFTPPVLYAPFDIEERLWFEGTWIVGSTGRGKTNLLRHLILNRLDKGSIVILDPKGDLLKSFENLDAIKDRLVVITPDLQSPPAINPLDMGTNSVDFLSYLFELLDNKMTANQETLFRAVLTLCTEIPGATIDTFREILRGGWRNYEQYLSKLDIEDRYFFEKEFTDKVYMERKPEILSRLRRLMQNKHFRTMFRSKRSLINFGQLMDAGKIILVNNSYNPNILDENGAEFFGRMIIAMVWAAARRRASLSDNQKTPVYFFIDEAHVVIARDKTIKKILNQCRSQKIAMIFAHQELTDIADAEVLSALADRPIVFASSRSHSSDLDKIVHAPESGFTAKQPRGSFACFVADKTQQAVSLKVPHVPVEPEQTLTGHKLMNPSEYDKFIERNRARYCLSSTPEMMASLGDEVNIHDEDIRPNLPISTALDEPPTSPEKY